MIRDLRNAFSDLRRALFPDRAGAHRKHPDSVNCGDDSGPSRETPERAPVVAELGMDHRTGRTPVHARRWWVLWFACLGFALVAGGLLVRFAVVGRIGEPADPNVVARFQGGEVTIADLRARYQALPLADRATYRSVAGLKALAGDVAAEVVLAAWARERQVDQRESFTEAMKHATEEIQIGDIAEQMHQGRITTGNAEVQAYYDQNRSAFGERPLAEVTEQVRQILVEQKERDFVQAYMEELRQRAGLQVDYGLLEVPEPNPQEVAAYYEANRGRFRIPARVRILQIQVSVSLAGNDQKAKARAETARARAVAGEDFAVLARTLGDGPEKANDGALAEPVAPGSRGTTFDENVMPLPIDAVSSVFKDGDSYYVVKILERWAEEDPALDQVRGTVAGMLRDDRTRDAFAERANRTLFTIHSRRTTLGEFLRERDELPTATRAHYAGTEGLRRLLDGMIDRILVVEDATEMATDVNRKDDISHVRTDLLARFLHQEQVDEALKVSDEEILREYRRNRGRYTEPARVKVRYIRVSRGQTDDADRIARSQITEARKQLAPRGFLRRGAAPADFAQVAARYSEDPDTAAKGGDLDTWIGESGNLIDEALAHRMHQALLPLKVGQLSPVLPLGDSYYLFEIREKHEARALSFEEARDLVQYDLKARRHEELNERMMRDLEGRVRLRIYERRLRALRDGLEKTVPSNGS